MAYRTRESSLADDVINYLEELKKSGTKLYWEHRSGSGGFNYKKGIPDLFIVVNGIHIECELKAPEGHLSSMQEKFKYRCQSEWGMWYCNPYTFKEFQEFISNFL